MWDAIVIGALLIVCAEQYVKNRRLNETNKGLAKKNRENTEKLNKWVESVNQLANDESLRGK